MTASTKMIADSVSPDGVRLCTIQCTFWRPILAEVNTHRDFSRNGASGRARSVKKTIQEVERNPVMPTEFRREHIGMSGGELLEGDELLQAQLEWLRAAKSALLHAKNLVNIGVHKSIVNRLIEPFAQHTHVITATEWDNFFAQRLALKEDGIPQADPEMYALALAMKKAMDESTPVELSYGEWHLPYITEQDRVNAFEITTSDLSVPEILRRTSVARCAGTSYLTQDKTDRDLRDDMRIYDKLVSARPPHWSPFEHVATPAPARTMRPPQRYNLRGWRSLRWVNDFERPLS